MALLLDCSDYRLISRLADFLRPQVETAQTLQDLAPSRLLEDLLKHRSTLLPPQVERAQKVLERAMPQRKNTRPVDQRISRSKLSVSGEDGREILRTQVPRTPSRASVPSSHTVERSQGSSSDLDESAPVSVAAPLSGGPTNSEKTAITEAEAPSALPVSIPRQASHSTASGIGAGDTGQVELESTQAKRPASIVTQGQELGEDAIESKHEPVQTDDVVLSLDNNNAGFANGGARLSRKRPVSKDLDQPIQEGESSLRRNASGEAPKGVVRGPRCE